MAARAEVLAMRRQTLAVLAVLVAGASLGLAQTTHAPHASPSGPASPASSRPPAGGAAPVPVNGYVVTTEIRATVPGFKAPQDAAPEARAMAGALQNVSSLTSRF